MTLRKTSIEHFICLSWIFLSYLAIATSANNEDLDTSNSRSDCQSGPDGLSQYGGTRTCIESLTFEGRRCFFTIIPDCAGQDSPLVFDSHGLASCPSETAELTRWKEMAQEHCFVLVYPLGTTDPNAADLTCWGLPGGAKDEFGDEAFPCCCSRRIRPVITQDAAFFRQIAAVTTRDVPLQTLNRVTVDTKRIYLAGHSNGCMASISIAAQSSDMIAAVGCHSGSAITAFPESYDATPMALVHGTKDRVVDYNGSFLFHSAQTTQSIIARANECTSFKETKTDDYMGSNNTVTELSSIGCKNDANVTMYAVEGAGHVPYLDADTYRRDEIPTRFDTTELMWDFVKTYSLDTNPSLVVRTIDQDLSWPSSDPLPDVSIKAPIQEEDIAADSSSSSLRSKGTFYFGIYMASMLGSCHMIIII